MDIVNDTPYVMLPFDCSPAPATPALTFVIKGTFELRAGEPAKALPKDEQPQVAADDPHMDDLGRSLRYSTDLVAVKTRGEVFVTGTCHVVGGRPKPTADVSIRVGAIDKTLRVTGDRRWTPGSGGSLTATAPQPFLSMPLRWELAFGGLAHATNPLGCGIDDVPVGDETVRRLPNIEYVDRRVTDPKDRPPPAAFGPVSPMWSPRLERQGTRDQRWAAFRAPLPPLDFDPRFYNAAPDDQQLPEGFFGGDEKVVLGGFVPEVPVFEAALPGKRLRLFVLLRKGAAPAAPPDEPGLAPARFVEVEPKLDTIHIDADAEKLTLVWRRPVQVKSRARTDLEALYLGEEELAREPFSREYHYARMEELRGPRPEGTNAAIDREVDVQMAEAKKILERGNVDPALRKQIDETKDPKKVFELLTRFVQDKTKDLERLGTKLKAPTR